MGSLYHHFGGKADLYLALYEQFADNQEVRAAAANALADAVLELVARLMTPRR